MTNKELVQRLFDEVYNARDFSACSDLVASAYVEHAIAPFGGDEPGTVEGPSHMQSVVEWLAGQFSDITMNVESVVSDGDVVVARVWSEGTNDGDIGPIPPTGKKFAGRQVHWYRVADGKLAEHWAVRDDLNTMLQLGVVRPPGASAGGEPDEPMGGQKFR
jgi:ketosteroid isomerase-like protein